MDSKYVIPVVIFFIIFYGYKKKVEIYDVFINGAVYGVKLVVDILPSIFALIFAVSVFINSGVIDRVFSFCNSHLIALGILRPLSGNGALAMVNNIFSIYGPDSFSGILASVMQGATDTTIYILALYFGSIRIKKTRYALGVGLFADLCGMVGAYIVVRLFF